MKLETRNASRFTNDEGDVIESRLENAERATQLAFSAESFRLHVLTTRQTKAYRKQRINLSVCLPA